MTWDVRYLDDTNIIYIVNKGASTNQDYEEQTIKALELAKEHNTHLFLTDNSEATNKAAILEIFYLPALYDKLGAYKINKLGVIVPNTPYKNEDYKFYETLCKNRGWNVKLFHDKDDAIEWLRTE